MKICIDPGHGMANRNAGVFDPGATHTEAGQLFREADFALRYGLALKDALRARGVSVFMTRDDNTDVAHVSTRAGMAQDAGCDAFLSLHMNDVESDQANGTETLYRGKDDATFADLIQRTAIPVLGLKDRGIKERTDLAVLKFKGPAALLELGFIGNDGDRNRLLSPQVRDALTSALADALAGLKPGTKTIDDTEGGEADHPSGGAAPYDTNATLLAASATLTSTGFASVFGGPGPATGFDWAAFEAKVASWGLKHFAAAELLYLGASHHAGGACGGKNGLPPENLWDSMEQTARFADAIRSAIGHPITVLSGYRNSAYNKCIRGETGSLHMKFNALDLRPMGGTLKDMLDAARKLRTANTAFRGGIGYYPDSKFIHIDTRGVNADW
jgi:N-acetylmuramoyl-L-alanine amidase